MGVVALVTVTVLVTTFGWILGILLAYVAGLVAFSAVLAGAILRGRI